MRHIATERKQKERESAKVERESVTLLHCEPQFLVVSCISAISSFDLKKDDAIDHAASGVATGLVAVEL